MKITNNNISKIKLLFERYMDINQITIDELTIGKFFTIHSHANLLTNKSNHVNAKKFGFDETWFREGNFIFSDYELYPDNSNDSHLVSVYKYLLKNIKLTWY